MQDGELTPLAPLCLEWQARLKLSDWHVEVKYERQYAMKAGKQGTIRWNHNLRTASIEILHPLDYNPDCIKDQDVEECLVHELVHLLLIYAGTDEPMAKVMEEHAVNALAEALVAMKRALA